MAFNRRGPGPTLLGALSSLLLHMGVLGLLLFWSLSRGVGGGAANDSSGLDSFPVSYAGSGENVTPNSNASDSSNPDSSNALARELSYDEEPEIALSSTENIALPQPTPKVAPKPRAFTKSPTKNLSRETLVDEKPQVSGTGSGTEAALQGADGSGGNGTSGSSEGDGSNSRARPISGPKPPYPPMAQRIGFEGSVTLSVSIDAAGHIVDAVVKQSSGRDDCDLSALKTLRERWTFEPAYRHGKPVASNEEVVVIYSLKDL